MFEDILRSAVNGRDIHDSMAAQGLWHGYQRTDGTHAMELRAFDDDKTRALLIRAAKLVKGGATVADVAAWLRGREYETMPSPEVQQTAHIDKRDKEQKNTTIPAHLRADFLRYRAARRALGYFDKFIECVEKFTAAHLVAVSSPRSNTEYSYSIERDNSGVILRRIERMTPTYCNVTATTESSGRGATAREAYRELCHKLRWYRLPIARKSEYHHFYGQVWFN